MSIGNAPRWPSSSPIIHVHSRTQGAGANLTCGYSGPDSATTRSMRWFQSFGLLANSTVSPTPPVAELVAMGRRVLGLAPGWGEGWAREASGGGGGGD